MTDSINKYCNRCKTLKTTKDFYKNKSTKDGLASQCKNCAAMHRKKWYNKNKERVLEAGKRHYQNNKDSYREGEYKRKFGITLDDFNILYKKQNGVCAICEKPETAKAANSNQVRQLSVDHCHKTGKIRGLLCSSCNLIIGRLGDNEESLRKLINYMKEKK